MKTSGISPAVAFGALWSRKNSRTPGSAGLRNAATPIVIIPSYEPAKGHVSGVMRRFSRMPRSLQAAIAALPLLSTAAAAKPTQAQMPPGLQQMLEAMMKPDLSQLNAKLTLNPPEDPLKDKSTNEIIRNACKLGPQ